MDEKGKRSRLLAGGSGGALLQTESAPDLDVD